MSSQELIAIAFKMTIALGVVLVFFGAALFLFKKFAGSSNSFLKKGANSKLKPMEVLAFQSLGPSRGLYLIRCLDQKILVGVTNSNISQIAQIAEEEKEDFSDFQSTLKEKGPQETKTQIKNSLKESLREIARI